MPACKVLPQISGREASTTPAPSLNPRMFLWNRAGSVLSPEPFKHAAPGPSLCVSRPGRASGLQSGGSLLAPIPDQTLPAERVRSEPWDGSPVCGPSEKHICTDRFAATEAKLRVKTCKGYLPRAAAGPLPWFPVPAPHFATSADLARIRASVRWCVCVFTQRGIIHIL